MKFKVVANDVVMAENCIAQKVLVTVIAIMQGVLLGETIKIQVFYLNKAGEWKLEAGFHQK